MAKKTDLTQKVLNKIKPYSVYPLYFGGSLFVNIAHTDPMHESFRKALLATFPKNSQLMNFKEPSKDKIPYLNLFICRCLVIKVRPEIWEDRPTLKDFRNDIAELKIIAEKRPPFIAKALGIIWEKYAHLHHISEEYSRWRLLFKPKYILEVNDILVSNTELQDMVQKYADHILQNFPKEESTGKNEKIVVVWLAEELQRLWLSAGYDPTLPRFQTDYINHFWEIVRSVPFDIPENDYNMDKIKKVLRDKRKPQPCRKIFRETPPSVYTSTSHCSTNPASLPKTQVITCNHETGLITFYDLDKTT